MLVITGGSEVIFKPHDRTAVSLKGKLENNRLTTKTRLKTKFVEPMCKKRTITLLSQEKYYHQK